MGIEIRRLAHNRFAHSRVVLARVRMYYPRIAALKIARWRPSGEGSAHVWYAPGCWKRTCALPRISTCKTVQRLPERLEMKKLRSSMAQCIEIR